jgi:hypothetical protein
MAQLYMYTSVPTFEKYQYTGTSEQKTYDIKHSYTKIKTFSNLEKHKYLSTIKLSAFKTSYAV